MRKPLARYRDFGVAQAKVFWLSFRIASRHQGYAPTFAHCASRNES